MTPLAAVAAGALAGAVGTACMDTIRYVLYRRDGGRHSPLAWEFPRVDSWEKAPDPDLGGVARPTAAEISYALGLWLGVAQ